MFTVNLRPPLLLSLGQLCSWLNNTFAIKISNKKHDTAHCIYGCSCTIRKPATKMETYLLFQILGVGFGWFNYKSSSTALQTVFPLLLLCTFLGFLLFFAILAILSLMFATDPSSAILFSTSQSINSTRCT